MRPFTSLITRALQYRPVEQPRTHVHLGAHGSYVCDVPGCCIPALGPYDR